MTFIFKRILLSMAFIASLCATASANIILDLDPAEGDQGVRESQVKPGDVTEIELIAQQGAQDIEGFEIALRFDPNNFSFKGFTPGGLMAGAIALPPQQSSDGVKISVGFLGRKSPGDAGSLGKVQVQVTQNFSGTAKISLIEGSFGAKGQTQKFPLNSEVTLMVYGDGHHPATGATKGTVEPPMTQPGMNQPPGQPGQQQGFGPGQQNQPPGQPSPEQMRQMFNRWMQSPQRADLNKDGRVNAEDFKLWFDQRNNQQGQGRGMGQGRGQGRQGRGGMGQGGPQGQGGQSQGAGRGQGRGQDGPQGGFQNQPPQGQGYHGGPQGGPTGGPGEHGQGRGGMGQGGPQGQGGQSQGTGRGQGRGQDGPQGGFQNQPPQGQGYHGGPQSGPMGGPGEHGPNPEEAIARLPQALQGTFKSTWKFSERAHMEAELKSQEKIIKTLMETTKYVGTASEEEKKQIAQVLMFFHMGGGEHGGSGEHGGPGGAPQMPENANVEDLIKKMMEEVSNDMAELKKALSEM